MVVSFRPRAKTGVGFAGQPKLQTRSGSAGVLVDLFRDENSRDTFAYSADVTGRNIARALGRAKWSFVAAARLEISMITRKPSDT